MNQCSWKKERALKGAPLLISVLLSSSPWLLFPISSSLSESCRKGVLQIQEMFSWRPRGVQLFLWAGRAKHGVGLLLFKPSLNGSVLEQAEPGTSS